MEVGLAHDFNNLLTIVTSNLAVLHERYAELPAVKEFVEPALQASRRGVGLIKRLLAFARPQPLEPEVVEVALPIENLTHLLRRSLPENIRIHTEYCAEPPPYVVADPHRLESALINIAVNARDAMPDGGELRIKVATENIEGDTAQEFEIVPGNHVKIEVTDSGTGMSSETLARALEPFFSTKPFGSGSGLGLSMVYGFVKQSGGAIRIRSEPRHGTTVSILLPWLPSRNAQPPSNR